MTKSKWKVDLNGYAGDIIFVLLFVLFAAFYYDSFLTKGPFTNHAWRQTDCLSLTYNYMEGANFFSPEVHNQLGDDLTSGKTAGEFPILYYTVGQLWKITGESYFVYRFVYLIILFTGLFALFKALKLLLKDWFLATFIPLLLFTSPVFVIYGVSFLTDIPAFCFVLIAGYFLTAYYFKKSSKYFWLAMLFFSLAGLIKVSSLIGFVFIFGIFILENLSLKSLKSSFLFKRSKTEWLGFMSAILAVFAWYYYTSRYNHEHDFKYTFNKIYPLWLIDKNEFNQLTSDIKNFTSYYFFNRSILYSLFVIGIFNLFQWKKLPLLGYLSTIAIFIGCSLYFIFWAPLMGVHDYYYGALLILFVGIILPFIWLLKQYYASICKSNVFIILASIFLAYNFIYTFGLVKISTLSQETALIKVGAPNFYDKVQYINYSNERGRRYEEIRPFLKALGVNKEDRVISIPDDSFNISLYLMHQKGWTSYAGGDQPEIIERLIKKGAKYMIISESATLKKENLQPFLTNEIGEFQGIHIFKLIP
jgi:hypothetical protein|tara:strand:- start:16706 stop:18301 length:1596 start_codon:yes stop_codon:yes gene_type:complete